MGAHQPSDHKESAETIKLEERFDGRDFTPGFHDAKGLDHSGSDSRNCSKRK